MATIMEKLLYVEVICGDDGKVGMKIAAKPIGVQYNHWELGEGLCLSQEQ